jgi:flagellar hook-associated protein 1 FlgK
MGLLTTALQIGRSSLLSYQAALQVTGNNMANAGNPDYTRQTPILEAIPGVPINLGIQPGAGIAISNIKRNLDVQLETRFRSAIADQEQATVEQRALGRIESMLNELTDTDLSTYLGEFFNSFAQLQINPKDLTLRDVVLINANALTAAIRRQRSDIDSLVEELNNQLKSFASDATKLSENIARLNVEIVTTEAQTQTVASPLRDQRDAAMRELSRLIEVHAVEQPNGSLSVYIGSEPVVEYGDARGLTTTEEIVNGVRLVTVRFEDNQSKIALNGGAITGTVNARDQHVIQQRTELDQLVTGLIEEVNKLHAWGQGVGAELVPGERTFFTNLTGTYNVLDANAALNTPAAGLDLVPQNGSFLIALHNADGTTRQTQINVDLDGIGADITLTQLAAALNAVAGITASVTPDNRLNVQATAAKTSFTFSDDTSNVLAALGVNTFFDGTDAADISLNALLSANPEHLAATLNRDVDGFPLPGDGKNAERIALSGQSAVASLGGKSIMDFYKTMVSRVAVSGSSARAAFEAADVIVGSLTAQRESISGVSLDEEAINLLKFERAFQGSARYVQTVDRLIAEMLSLVR